VITIADRTLSRLVTQAKPHMADRAEPESIQVLMFDYDGTHLHCWATNRYTVGIARTKATGKDKPWTAVVGRLQVAELQAAIRLLDHKPINVSLRKEQLVLSGDAGTVIAIELADIKAPLDWRKIMFPALDEEAASTQMAMTPKYFAAWKNLPGPVRMWSTGENRMILISAPDFLGAQMPVRREGEDAALRRELDSWKPAEPEPVADAA
jgi:hypothetical protein